MLGLVILIVLVVLLFGSAPTWPYSRGWGYGPSGILGILAGILLILMLFELVAAPWHRTVVVGNPVVVTRP